MLINNKGEEPGKFFTESGTLKLNHPSIRPKENGPAITQHWSSQLTIFVSQFKHITPPKGSTECGSMRDRVGIVCIPNKANLGDVMMIIKLVQELHKQGLILHLEVEHTKTPFVFW